MNTIKSMNNLNRKEVKGLIMNSGKSLEILYTLLEKKFGSQGARNSIQTIVACAIGEIQDEGLPINEENINHKLSKCVADYQFAMKSEVA
jgi:hypothetical protein